MYSGVQSPREGEIGFCDRMAFRQGKDCEAAGESKIFISLVCSHSHMFRWLLGGGSSSSASRHFNCTEYIEQAELHRALVNCLFLRFSSFS